MGLSGIVCENELFSSAEKKEKEKVRQCERVKNTHLIL